MYANIERNLKLCIEMCIRDRAYYLQGIEVLAKVGQDTLYLCGSEYMIKIVVPSICGIVGLSINLDGPLYVCIYTIMLLWAGEKIFVPWEKNIIRKMRR